MFKPFLKYADFAGRARRLEYWLFQLLQIIVYLVLLVMIVATLSTNGIASGLGVFGVIIVFALGSFVPNLAVTARRLHDTGRSAWWLMLYAPGVLTGGSNFHALQVLGTGYARAAAAAATQGSLLGLAGGICSLIMLALMGLPGNRGANRFGPSPKGGRSDADEIASVFDAPEADPAPPVRKSDRDSGEPYKPVFDFGPSPASSAPAVRTGHEPAQPRPVAAPSSAPTRPTFGKRR